jgi:hypothetical protein
MAIKPNSMRDLPARPLGIALGLYACVIVVLSLLAIYAQSQLTTAKLRGVISSLKSINAESQALSQLRGAGALSESFVSAEMSNAAQVAKGLKQTAEKIDAPEQERATRDTALDLAARIVAKGESRSSPP